MWESCGCFSNCCCFSSAALLLQSFDAHFVSWQFPSHSRNAPFPSSPSSSHLTYLYAGKRKNRKEVIPTLPAPCSSLICGTSSASSYLPASVGRATSKTSPLIHLLQATQKESEGQGREKRKGGARRDIRTVRKGEHEGGMLPPSLFPASFPQENSMGMSAGNQKSFPLSMLFCLAVVILCLCLDKKISLKQ